MRWAYWRTHGRDASSSRTSTRAARTLDGRGRLQVGGCDVLELAAEFGTPAYVVDEDDLRSRAREFREAFAALHDDVELVFATKAFPCTAVLRLFAEEGFGCDVASGGELALALKAGVDARRGSTCTATPRATTEIQQALDAGIGDIVVDNFDDLDKLERLVPDGRDPSPCSCASRPTSPATPTRRSRPARPTRSSASASTRRAWRSTASRRTTGSR